MIGTHSLPTFEHNVDEIGEHYYIVSALDINENEGEHSEMVNVTSFESCRCTWASKTFALHQNYPNPFNPNTTIRYDLPEAGNVSITIYDMMGREVTTLISGQKERISLHPVEWNKWYGLFCCRGCVYVHYTSR